MRSAPSDSIQITFAYDDTALYVGARMSSAHAPIQAPLGRRDDVGQAEYIIVALDTYLDHRTAYGFGVTASGVRLDRFYPADAEDFADLAFDLGHQIGIVSEELLGVLAALTDAHISVREP